MNLVPDNSIKKMKLFSEKKKRTYMGRKDWNPGQDEGGGEQEEAI